MKKQTDIRKPVHRFKPGESGNPKGRPKGSGHGIKDLLRQFGEWECPGAIKEKLVTLTIKDSRGNPTGKVELFPARKIDKLTLAEAIYLKVYVEALRGESWAVQFIAERTEGKVKETMAIENIKTVLVWPSGADNITAETT